MVVFGEHYGSTAFGEGTITDSESCYTRENIVATINLRITIENDIDRTRYRREGTDPPEYVYQHDTKSVAVQWGGSGKVIQTKYCDKNGLEPWCGATGVRVSDTLMSLWNQGRGVFVSTVSCKILVDVDQDRCLCGPCPEVSECEVPGTIQKFNIPSVGPIKVESTLLDSFHPDQFEDMVDSNGQLCVRGSGLQGLGGILGRYSVGDHLCNNIAHIVSTVPGMCCKDWCRCVDIFEELKEQGKTTCPV